MLNSVGVFVITYLETGFHRAVVSSDNSKKHSELLSLTAIEFKSIVWIGSRDFIFDGKVYDCDNISSAKGKINMFCQSDNVETNLKNSLASDFDNGTKNAPASKSMKDVFKVFPFFKNSISATTFSLTEFFSFHFQQGSKLLPQSADLSLNSPPPEMA